MTVPADRATAPTDRTDPQVVVLTGLSGAGRRAAAGQFEDLGWEVVDNVPAPLLPPLLDLLESTGSQMVLTLGASRRDGPGAAVESLRARLAEVRVLYLEATTAVLVRRFTASRRRHPLADAATQHLTLAIGYERDRLNGRVHRQFLGAFGLHGVDAG